MSSDKPSVVIIGAGIIGSATAALLSDEGHDVTVVDPAGICDETSAGNAAAFAFADLLPLAHKGMLRQLPKWLTDPLGPLTIRPSYLPKLLPWLMRFLKAGNSHDFERSVAAQAALMNLARTSWDDLTARTGTASFLRHDGCLELYDTAASFEHARKGYAMRERYGVAFDVIERARLGDYQPGLSDDFACGVFIPGWMTVGEPRHFGQALFGFAEKNGACLIRQRALAILPGDDGVKVRLADGQILEVDRVVLAAGAWSAELARSLGDRIPLDTERGYNTTLPSTAFDLRRQLVFCDHGFVATRLDTGIRIGGAVEFGGLELAPDYRRSKAMLKKARRFLPALETDGGREWMGFRPSLPDSLPVIGPSRASTRILYAFGHGHLGLTQAAATARLVGDQISGQAGILDLSPFSAQRF